MNGIVTVTKNVGKIYLAIFQLIICKEISIYIFRNVLSQLHRRVCYNFRTNDERQTDTKKNPVFNKYKMEGAHTQNLVW